MFFCNSSYSESYYFNKCKLNERLSADYLIDIDKKIIKSKITTIDGDIQELNDKIKLINKDQIISEIIQNLKNKKYYLQYYLDTKTESVVRQRYVQKEKGGLILPDGPKKSSLCKNVKAGWDKIKIDEADLSKEQKQILKAQEEILAKQSLEVKCKGSYKKWDNCQGSYINDEGHKYDGRFKNGFIVEGIATYAGDTKYVGEFKNNLPHGQGTFSYSDGSKYFGQWVDGKQNGFGNKIWNNGIKYVGTFKNDEPYGNGTFTSPDGEKYVGEWKDGKRHGKGTLTYPNGKIYIGQFVAGYEHGEGTCFNKAGDSIDCKKDISTSIKNAHDISIVGEKWIPLSKYNFNSGENLKKKFDKKALDICSTTRKYKILEQKVEMLEMDETPAFGIETVIKIGVNGVIVCE